MSSATLTETVKAAMKAAMKARDKERLGTIRLIQSEFKRIEVDERIEIDDARALAVLDKMIKQRRDSAQQYQAAERPELAAQEEREIAVIQEFLPSQLSDAELDELIDAAIARAERDRAQDLGAVVGDGEVVDRDCGPSFGVNLGRSGRTRAVHKERNRAGKFGRVFPFFRSGRSMQPRHCCCRLDLLPLRAFRFVSRDQHSGSRQHQLLRMKITFHHGLVAGGGHVTDAILMQAFERHVLTDFLSILRVDTFQDRIRARHDELLLELARRLFGGPVAIGESRARGARIVGEEAGCVAYAPGIGKGSVERGITILQRLGPGAQ